MATELSKKPTKAVIYCRVSSARQVREGDGLGSQEQRCRKYAEQRGLKVIRAFRDEGISGGLIDRPAMSAMRQFIEKLPDEVYVIVDDMSRWARETQYHFMLKKTLRESGGILISLNQNLEDESAEGKLVETIQAATVSFEREKNARQVKDRTKARLERGLWTFAKVPLGYEWGVHPQNGKVLVKSEPLASLIAEAFEGFARGRFCTLHEVRVFLKGSGIFPLNKQNDIAYDRIRRMFKNLAYAGYIVNEKFDVPMTKSFHEPLVSLADFNLVQQRLGAKSYGEVRRDTRDDFPLRNKVLCHSCGDPLTGSWSNNGRKKYAYYKCRKKECSEHGKSIPVAKMDEGFREVLDKIAPSQIVIDAAQVIIRDLNKEKAQQHGARLMDANRKIKALERSKEELLDNIIEKQGTKLGNALEERFEGLEYEIESLRHETQRAETIDTSDDAAVGTVMEFIKNPRNLWDNGDKADRHLVMQLTFASKLRYHRKHGFGTADLSLPFSVLGGFEVDKMEMVDSSRNLSNRLIDGLSNIAIFFKTRNNQGLAAAGWSW